MINIFFKTFVTDYVDVNPSRDILIDIRGKMHVCRMPGQFLSNFTAFELLLADRRGRYRGA